MKKVLLMSGFFYFSLFSMDPQLQLIENGSFGSNISDVSDYSSSASDEDSDSSGCEESQVANLEIVVGKGFRYGGDIVSLTELMKWFSADLQAMDKQYEAQQKENEKKLSCMAKVMVIQQGQIKKLAEENEKIRKDNEELASAMQRSPSSPFSESITELLKVIELVEEKPPSSDIDRKTNRLSFDVTQLKKRNSPRKNSPRTLFIRISKRIINNKE